MRIPGIIHRSDLAARGCDRNAVRRLLRRGAMRYVAPWYVTEEAPADLVDLLARGVRPTCLDAAALHGLWVPIDDRVHAFAPRTARTLAVDLGMARQIRRRRDHETGMRTDVAGSRQGPVVLHGPVLQAWPTLDPVPDLDLVLSHAGRCLPVVSAAILFESSVETGALALGEAQNIVASLPHGRRRALSRIRGDAESGTETFVRWLFESRRFEVRSQVWIAADHRADLLVGRSWIIECDSRAFHDDPAQYRKDRERDLRSRALGYTVTRLTWEQVFVTWDQTEQALLAVLARGDHRRALPGR